MGFYIAVLVATLIAVGAGWFLGGQLAVNPTVDKGQATKITTKDEESPGKVDNDDAGYGDKNADGEKDKNADKKGGSHSGSVVTLDPILVALRNSNNAFLRLELVLIMNEGAYLKDEESRVRLLSELSEFSKTMTLRQISGPSGYLHFREDLLDRARLSTKGGVKDLLIMSMVAE